MKKKRIYCHLCNAYLGMIDTLHFYPRGKPGIILGPLIDEKGNHTQPYPGQHELCNPCGVTVQSLTKRRKKKQ